MTLLRARSDQEFSGLQGAHASQAPSLFGQTINDVHPLIGGTADLGCLVMINVGGAVFAAPVNEAGRWSLDTAVETPLSGHFDLRPDGPKKLVVISVGPDGRSLAVQGEFTISTVPPEVPTLATVRVFNRWPLLDGHAQAGSEVLVTFAGAAFRVIAASSGAWTLDSAKQQPDAGLFELGFDGPVEVLMVCTDVAGNTSTATDTFVLQRGYPAAEHATRPSESPTHRAIIAADAARAWRAALGSRPSAPHHPAIR
ncbi:hypothetical protein GN316_20480 [Xylophilus sp. Kf1]|nr:hypothetical protein [Xylophilus sp. Kf1]